MLTGNTGSLPHVKCFYFRVLAEQPHLSDSLFRYSLTKLKTYFHCYSGFVILKEIYSQHLFLLGAVCIYVSLHDKGKQSTY
jgi:hypothetical protein